MRAGRGSPDRWHQHRVHTFRRRSTQHQTHVLDGPHRSHNGNSSLILTYQNAHATSCNTSQLHLAVCMCHNICQLFLHLNRQFHFTRNAQCSDSLVETGCCSGHVIQLQVAQGCLVAERLEKAVADAGEEGVGTDFVLIDTAKTVASELNELLTLAQEEEAERLRKEEVARLKVQFPPDLMIADMVMCARPRRRKRRRSDR